MQELFTIIPWICLLIVFGGMAILLWQAQRNAATLSQLLVQLFPKVAATVPLAIPHLPAPASPPVIAPPAPLPAKPPVGPFAAAPIWFQLSLHDIGFHETGDNQGIEEFIAQSGVGALGDPWCAIWMNAKLAVAKIPGTGSAAALSFTKDPFIQLDRPSLGCIVVFWRNSRASGQGHVGEYWGENDTHVWVLGGNENNMVQVEALPKDSPTFGLIGYYWPKSVPLPTTGPVLMPAGSPIQIQTPPAGAPTAAPAVTRAQGAEFGAMVAGGYFSSTPFDKNIPASIRTNNPGALNVAPWIKNAPGYVGDKITSMSGAEANSTVIFSTPEYGVAAWFTLLQKYRAAGAITLGAIINRYGGGQDYSSYVGEVAAWSGLSEQAEINLDDDAMLLVFGKAMFRYEAGRPSPLSDAQILYGFNLARGPAHATQAATVPSPPPTVT